MAKDNNKNRPQSNAGDNNKNNNQKPGGTRWMQLIFFVTLTFFVASLFIEPGSKENKRVQ